MSSENYDNQTTMSDVYKPFADATPSELVVTTIADATDQSPLELAPLFERIDPDALDALIDWSAPDSSISISFEYLGYTVLVSPAGVRLAEAE